MTTQVSAIAEKEAHKIDERIRLLTSNMRSTAIELGGLLLRMKREKLYTRLGFDSFGQYIESHGFSSGYGERIMRAHRIVVEHPELKDLDVNRILFVDNVTKRNTGKSWQYWTEFARKTKQDDLRGELKRLTRAGYLPDGDGRSAVQAIKHAHIDCSMYLKLRVPAKTYKLFQEQCKLWNLDMASTLLKLIVIAGGSQKDDE